MPGNLLRTNYRKTGGSQNITAIAGHLLSASAFGGAGFKLDQYPNGGFMVMSVSGSIQGAEATAGMYQTSGPTGCSRAWIDSTYGLMSRFNGNPVSGYQFHPFGFRFYSFSGVGYAAAEQSIPRPFMKHVSHSGSLIFVSILLQLPESAMSFSARGTAEFKAEVWGFIISAP